MTRTAAARVCFEYLDSTDSLQTGTPLRTGLCAFPLCHRAPERTFDGAGLMMYNGPASLYSPGPAYILRNGVGP